MAYLMGQLRRKHRIVRQARTGMLILLFLLSVFADELPAQTEFNHVFHSFRSDGTSAIVQSSDGGYIIESGGRLLKLSPSGFPIWKYTGGYSFSSVSGMGGGRIIAVGNAHVAIFSSNGSLLFNDTSVNGYIASVASRGDTALVAAYDYGSGGAGPNIFLRMITSDGIELWNKRIPDVCPDFSNFLVIPHSIVLSRANDYLVVSKSFTYCIGDSGKTLWKKPHYVSNYQIIRGEPPSETYYVGNSDSFSGDSYRATAYDSIGTAIDTFGSGVDFAVSADRIGTIFTTKGSSHAEGYYRPVSWSSKPFWTQGECGPVPPPSGAYFYWNGCTSIASTNDGGYVITAFYGGKISESYGTDGLLMVIKTDSLGNTDTMMHVSTDDLGSVSSAPTNDAYLYPNPTTGRLTIRNNAGLNSIRVTNTLGIEVARRALASPETELQVDLSQVPSGMYFVTEICADGTSRSHKIQKRE